MQVINLTPHQLDFRDAADSPIWRTLPSEGQARCAEVRERVGDIDSDADFFRVNRVGLGAVTGLPAPAVSVFYVVSRMVAEALPQRTDLVFPDEILRDERGQIVGCRSLGQLWR